MSNQEILLTMDSSYLPLTEYSSKYKVSISTLRRRIKADDIKYIFEDGKYLIMDEPVGTHQKVHRPSLSSEQTFLAETPASTFTQEKRTPAPKMVTGLPPKSSAASNLSGAQAPSPHLSPSATKVASVSLSTTPAEATISPAVSSQWHAEIQNLSNKENHEPILTAANRLLTELKKAYTQVLQEKEEQILHLKEEMTDLKTLIRVLESDNERKRR
ncbi:MAG: hypothetical protein KF767_04710 [Bdellovibrionaceae bacterium]|nr:hypothetical protein [Pseudobdellovibrionaceae bacterium]